MDQNQKPGQTLDESIQEVMQTLPPVIRAYLARGRYTVVAKSLMAKYGLRLDQAGVLEREIMLLLMGIEDPDEFVQALTTEARLAKEIVDGIVQDVNTEIFVPLRAEEMKGGAPMVSPPAAPVVPSPADAQPQKFFHLDNKIPPPRPAGAQFAVPRPPAPAVVPPRPPQAAAPSARPALREVLASVTKVPQLTDSSRLLEDHEEPHIEFHTAPQVPRPVLPHPIAPGARAPFVGAPKAVPPVPPAPPRPAPQAAPVAPVQPKQVTPAAAPAAPAKPYTADPYREPIEP